MDIDIDEKFSIPYASILIHFIFSEMWSLFNISDSKTLTIFELESGVMRVTQSEELFDCLPAVRAAFHFTKVFFNNGVDEEEEAEKKAKEEQEKNKTNEEVDEVIKAPTRKVEKTLEFFEFRLFLQTLRQYYLYCQVMALLLLIYHWPPRIITHKHL